MTGMRGVFVASHPHGGFGRYGFDAMGRAYRHGELYATDLDAIDAIDPDWAGPSWEPLSPLEVRRAELPPDSVLAAEVRRVSDSAHSRLTAALADLDTDPEMTRHHVVPAVVAVLRQPGVSPLAAAWAVGNMADPRVALLVRAAFVTSGTDAELTAARVNVLRVAAPRTVPAWWFGGWNAHVADRWLDAASVEPLTALTLADVSQAPSVDPALPADVLAAVSRTALRELTVTHGHTVVDMGRARAIEAVAAAGNALPDGSWSDRLNLAVAYTRSMPAQAGQPPLPDASTVSATAVGSVAWEDVVIPAEVGVPSTHMAISLVAEYLRANGDDISATAVRDALSHGMAMRALRAQAVSAPSESTPPSPQAPSFPAAPHSPRAGLT